MVKTLERLGLAFGADTNASTAFDETTYKLDLPRTDDETVDTSLMLLRQAASELTIAPDAVNRERGVVLSEERSSDTPSYRVYKARMAYLLQGQRMPTRYPIGKVDILNHAPASQIVDFYHHYYRPDRAVIVAVGDFDPAAMEAKIKAKFGDWKAVGPAGPEPDLGTVQPRTTEAKLVVEPGSPLNLQMTWVRPPDLRADTAAKRRGNVVEQLGFAVLNRRLSALARGPKPPFLGAVGFKTDQGHSAELTMLNVGAEPDRWREALAAVDQEQRRAVQYGVRQDELDREIEEMRASLKAAVSGAATRRPSELANDIVDSLDDDEIVTSPADDLALFESAVKGLKADTVSAALKDAFQGGGPLLFMASPKPVQGGDQALLAELETSQKVAVAAPEAPHQVVWPYESFGTPGKVAETKDVLDLDTVFVRFGNGVRLTIKPTKFRDDEVLVRVSVGDGLLDFPKDRQSLAWFGSAFVEGGLKKIDNEDTERVLASKVYGVRFGIGDDAFVLTGSTRTDDLPTQMQVLTAYVSDPGWRPQAFDRLKSAGKTVHDQLEATDSGVLSRELSGLLHTGDRRFTFPSRDDIAKAQLTDLEGEVAPHLASDPIDVVIVGDITVEKATEAVARTFGALPPRKPETPATAVQRQMSFPAATAQPVVFTHKGRADQSIGYVAWPATDYWTNPQLVRDTAILHQVMELRLIEQLREAEGATYSPSVSDAHSLTWNGWGYFAASVEVPPQKLDTFFTDVEKIAADLRTKPVTADELERAKKPRIDAIEKAQLTNQYWLSELSGAQEDPRRLDLTRQLLPGTERVTAADVQNAAKIVLNDDKAFKLIVKPK
jgi:zinc protease